MLIFVFSEKTTLFSLLKLLERLWRSWLTREPFLLIPQQAELVARYCTENNALEKIEYDETAEVDFNIFKSIMKYVIGDYNIIKSKKMDEMFISIKERLSGKRRHIIETFVKVMKIRSEFVSYEELLANFNTNDIKFTKDELMVILIKTYEKTESIDQLNYKDLFDN